MTENSIGIIEYLKERRKKLDIDLERVKKELESIKYKINHFDELILEEETKKDTQNTTKNLFESDDFEYTSNMKISQKVIYILNNEKRFLHFKEIAYIIKKYEKNSIDINDLVKDISSGTQSLKKAKKIDNIKLGHLRNTFWGLPGWKDEEGKPLKDYMYNQKAVFVKGSGVKPIFN